MVTPLFFLCFLRRRFDTNTVSFVQSMVLSPIDCELWFEDMRPPPVEESWTEKALNS